MFTKKELNVATLLSLSKKGYFFMKGIKDGKIIKILDADIEEGELHYQECDKDYAPITDVALIPAKIIGVNFEHTQSPSELAFELNTLKRVFAEKIAELQIKLKAKKLERLYCPEPVSDHERGTSMKIGTVQFPSEIKDHTYCQLKIGDRVRQIYIQEGYSENDSRTLIEGTAYSLTNHANTLMDKGTHLACILEGENIVHFYLVGPVLPLIKPRFIMEFLNGYARTKEIC